MVSHVDVVCVHCVCVYIDKQKQSAIVLDDSAHIPVTLTT